MAASDWQQQFTLRTAEVVPSTLPGVLDEVNEALKDTEALSYLMVNYWNGPGTFSDYTVGRQELTRRIDDCVDGSAFGGVGEVRWRKIGSVFRVVLIAEAGLTALPLRGVGATWHLEVEEIERARCRGDRCERSILFWGSRLLADEHTWVEARIPRPLRYPTLQKSHDSYDHIRLYFVEYQDDRGRTIIHRRTHLTAYLKSPRNNQESGE